MNIEQMIIDELSKERDLERRRTTEENKRLTSALLKIKGVPLEDVVKVWRDGKPITRQGYYYRLREYPEETISHLNKVLDQLD